MNQTTLRGVSRCSIPLPGDSAVFFYPWYPAMMLAVEANKVIDIRVRKMASGGVNAATEAQLMVSEKLDALAEASLILMRGGSTVHVIDNYRKLVAANATRLTD